MNQGAGFRLTRFNLKSLHLPEVLTIINLLSNSGQARLVGGCVRDSLIGKEVKDIDIATTYEPREVVRILNSHNIQVILTGFDFGTITAIYNGKSFEITSLRRDVATDGRHAKVEYTKDWKEDALRRDFTINALSYDPVQEKLHDYNNGLEDLIQGRVCFIGDALQRILEDHLRILRYFRFAINYSKEGFDEKILDIISENKDLILKLSGQRIKEEILKILSSPNFIEVIRLCEKLKLMTIIFGEAILAHQNYLEYLRYSQDSSHSLRVLFFLYPKLEQVLELVKKWNFSNKIKYKLECYYKSEIVDFSEHTIKYLLYKFEREIVIDLLYIYDAKNQLQDHEFIERLDKINSREKPIFPISGKDILSQNITGPDIGKLLSKAEKMWIASDFNMRKAEILKLIND